MKLKGPQGKHGAVYDFDTYPQFENGLVFTASKTDTIHIYKNGNIYKVVGLVAGPCDGRSAVFKSYHLTLQTG